MDNPINILITKTDVEDILNYFMKPEDKKIEINNLDLYQIAFTNESYYQSVKKTISTESDNVGPFYINYIPKESNERLEFLGDHVLKVLIAHYLYERFPNEREGFYTPLKIKLEKKKMLHKIGEILGFKKYILLSLQVENTTILDSQMGRMTPSFYEDCFESFIGAVFDDLGYEPTKIFFRNVIEHIIDFAELNSTNDNFKDSLQRYFQSFKWKPPTYIKLSKEKTTLIFKKTFTSIVYISKEQFNILDDFTMIKIIQYHEQLLNYIKTEQYIDINLPPNIYIIGIGMGRKITDSEQNCAKQCLINLNIESTY